MKILQVAGSGTVGTSDMGPVSTDICELANQFSSLGHHVTVVDAASDAQRPHLATGVTITALPSRPRANIRSGVRNRLVRRYSIWRNELHFVSALLKKVDVNSFDIVHIHEWEPAFILGKIFRRDYVYTSHTPLWCLRAYERDDRSKSRKLYDAVKGVFVSEKLVIEGSVATIALGSYLQACVPKANIVVIQDGIELEQFSPMKRQAARQVTGLSDDEFLIVCVGRVRPEKGFDVLIEAVRGLQAEIPNLRVMVIGSLGQSFNVRNEVTIYAKTLMALAADLPITFTGFIDNRTSEFKSLVSSADVFVVPSLYEAQGKVVLEALAMGKMVIGSSTGGIPEMLNDRVGRIFTAGDSEQLGNCIKEVFFNRASMDGIEELCIQHVRRNFTWRSVAQRHIELFGNLLSKK